MRMNFLSMGRKNLPAEKRTVRPACSGRRERGTLIVDCRGCRLKQDLAEPRCLKGVIRIMASEPPGIREILLSRDWEIVYDRECADALSGVGDIIRFTSGITFQQPFEDCASCLSNPRTVIVRVVDSLPQPAPELGTHYSRPSGGHGRACEQCVRTLRINLDHIKHLLDLAELRINKTAFRVVCNDEH